MAHKTLNLPELPGGFTYPLTPTGKGNLIPAPPYHFCCSEMILRYQADPDQVRRFLPEPLTPSEVNPGGCILHVCSYVSRNGNDDLLVELPERCNYNECYLEIRANYRGLECKHFAYYWVNRDYSILRGMILGLPKKGGEISTTFEKVHLFHLNPNFPQFGAGFRMGGVVSSHMEKLITASIALDRQITLEEVDPELRMPCRNLVCYPDAQIGYQDRAFRRIGHTDMDVWYGDIWRGKDEKVAYLPSIVEEHDLLKPLSITESYYMDYAFTTYGGIVDEVLA